MGFNVPNKYFKFNKKNINNPVNFNADEVNRIFVSNFTRSRVFLSPLMEHKYRCNNSENTNFISFMEFYFYRR